MKTGNYLSQVITPNELCPGRLNLIIARTGQGKTTMATQTLPALLNLTNRKRILFLIDTNMGEDQLLDTNEFQHWEEQDNKIYLMTYHKFGTLLKKYEIWAEMFDLVIADEFHNLYKYAKIDEARMRHANPDFSYETISIMLARESTSYRAMEAIKKWSTISSKYVVALTATPQQFLEKDKELSNFLHLIQYNEGLVAYEILEKNFYTQPSELLSQNPDTKRLIFAPTIQLAEEFQETIKENTDRNAIVLHSVKNETHEMNSEALQARNYLIHNNSFPKNVDDIIATEAYATGWNLKDERVKEVICHTGNEIIQEQFCGRLRQDIPRVYIYDSNGAKNEKEKERRKEKSNKILNQNWIIPTKYLNIRLNTEMKKELIKDLNFPKAWPSLKKVLINQGYKITEERTNEGRFSVIQLENQ